MGSAASAPIKQQAKALKGRRYMHGMRPEKYFEMVVKKEHRELLDMFGFSDAEAFEIFVQFISIDDDNSGEVSVDEFHKHLDSQATKFSERVFAVLDQDMSGLLDLREFITGVWNYCTYDTKLVCKLLFDIFDVDRIGKITMAELDAMLRMLYGSLEADSDLLKMLAINGNGDEDALTFDEFCEVVKGNYQVVQPAFELQKAIRRRILGVRYWEKMTKQRTKMFAGYDQGTLTSMEAVEAIVMAKHKERLAGLEKEKQEVAARHDEKLRLAAEEQHALHQDHQLRKTHKLQELRDARPAEEVEEERAWKALRESQAVIKTDFTERNVSDLRAARERVWESYDRAVKASKARAKTRAETELELAVQDDAKSKADAWILTKQGSVRYDFLCRQAYGNLLHREYVRRGPPLKAFAALHAFDDSPVTLATSIAYTNARPTMLKEARAAARLSVVQRFAKQEAAEAAARSAKEVAQQEADFSALHQQIVAEAGARGTSWDLLWDPTLEDRYYRHTQADGNMRRYPKEAAVCHKCDEIIAPEDRVCAQCGEPRNPKNERLYVGFKV